MTEPRITEKMLHVLRLAKDGNAYGELEGSRNGGRGKTISALKNLGYLDWHACLTIEGGRVLQENAR